MRDNISRKTRRDISTQTLPENWLDTATSYASTKWLAKFIRFHLAQLEAGNINAAEFADELEQEFASRRLTTPAQQKNYRSNVVMALRQLDPQHPAIELVTLSTEQYRILNDEQRGRLADRETRFIHHEVVDTLVEIATNLLGSEEWSDVGAGLAVLVGRRISEIIFADFAPKSPWSLAFTQMVKKAEGTDITIEIPTLAPASIVLAAINRLQDHLGKDLHIEHTSQREARRIANSRYSGAIASKCGKYFSGMVPDRSDRDNLYTHIFRAVYATIAAHWYCPPNIPEHQFKSEIQGHFTLTQDGKKLPNYSARSNYDDYAIGDGNGNRDGRLGIKLGQVEGLQVIDAFRPDDKSASEAMADDDKPAIKVFDFSPMPHWIDDAVGHATADWLQQFLRHQLPQLAQDVLSLQEFADELTEELKVRGFQQFQQQQSYREQVVGAIREGFYDHPALSLITDPSPTIQPTTQNQDPATATSIPPAIDQTQPRSRSNSMASPTAKQPIKRPTLYAEDVELMNRLMSERQVTGNPAEIFRALLETFITETKTTKQQEVATLSDFAQTLNWFTNRVSQLEQERDQLQQEQGQSQSQPSDTHEQEAEIAQLRERNAQLEQELQATQSRLDRIHSLLGGSGNGATAPTPAVSTKAAAKSSAAATTSAPIATEAPPKKHDINDSIANIAKIVDAIIQWNEDQERSERRLQISFPSVKSLAVLMESGTQSSIRKVMEEKAAAIDAIHKRYMMGSRHNRSVRDKDGVLKAIAKDYLGLSNWEEAEYNN